MDNKLHIAIVGDTGVGKTALAERFVSGAFKQNLDPNLGGKNYEKQLNVNGQIVHIQIWDTAGQEQYKALAPFYYRNAHVVIIVFALGDHNPQNSISRISLNSVDDWYEQIRRNNGDAIIVLCGSMDDLENREVTYEEGKHKANTLPDAVEYFETSSLTGDGIDELFQFASERFLDFKKYDNEQQKYEDNPQPPILDLNQENQRDTGGWCC